MKVSGFTLIEGLVSMVLLSILLTVSMFIGFNLYRSLSPIHMMHKQEVVDMVLDSLCRTKRVEPYRINRKGLSIFYNTKQTHDFENVLTATCTAEDSLGSVFEAREVFYVTPKEN